MNLGSEEKEGYLPEEDNPSTGKDSDTSFTDSFSDKDTKVDEEEEFQALPTLPSGYLYVKKISHGAQGVVWQVYNSNVGRHEAVKVLLGMTSKERQRFNREMKTVAALSHPYIVTIYYASPQECYFIMEYLSGGSLTDFINRKEVSLLSCAKVLKQIARGLHFAHEKGLVHRDLKPENILFSAEMMPKITDFGIVKKVEEGMTLATSLLGTPEYMAPEQWKSSKEVDHRCDIWALGIILYRMLAGRYPFPHLSGTALMYPTIVEDITPPHTVNPNLTEDERILEKICLRALEKNLEDRYTTASEMAQELEYFISRYSSLHLENKYKNQIATTIDLEYGSSWGDKFEKQKEPLTKKTFILDEVIPKQKKKTWLQRLENAVAKQSQKSKNVFYYFKAKFSQFLYSLEEQRRAIWTGLTGGVILVILLFSIVIWDDSDSSNSSVNSISKTETKIDEKTDSDIDPKLQGGGWHGESLPEGLIKGEYFGEYIWTKDQSIMVYVPAGNFYRLGEEFLPDEKIYLPAYYIDKYEVTNRQFEKFLKNCSQDVHTLTWKKTQDQVSLEIPWDSYLEKLWASPEDYQDHPLVGVNWEVAKQYTKWVGKNLPSIQQWEKAGRGGVEIQGSYPVEKEKSDSKRIFTWGSTIQSAPLLPHRSTYKVGTWEKDVSPYGCYDLCSNAMEWCADIQKNEGRERVIVKGGHWKSSDERYLRIGEKKEYLPSVRSFFLGFRTVLGNVLE